MMFSRPARVAAALCVSAAAALTLSSCGGGYTVDYLYVVSSGSQGTAQAVLSSFDINNDSGGISKATGSQMPPGNGPSSAVATHNGQLLFVANQGGGQVTAYSINEGDGSLSGAKTITTPGGAPVSIAVDLNAKYLFVLDSAVPAGTTGPYGGVLSSYTIGSGGSMTLVNSQLVAMTPAGVATNSTGSDVYVTATNGTTGVVETFTTNSSGALAQGTTVNSGVQPTGIVVEPLDRFIYVTDKAQAQVYGFIAGSGGSITQLQSSPFPTGGQAPVAITVEPRGRYVYVVNSFSSTISAFSIQLPNGALNSLSNPLKTGTDPVSVTVDPLQGQYVYTANFVDNSVSGYKLSSSTGQITPLANSPFIGSFSGPTAVTAAPKGAAPAPGQL